MSKNKFIIEQIKNRLIHNYNYNDKEAFDFINEYSEVINLIRDNYNTGKINYFLENSVCHKVSPSKWMNNYEKYNTIYDLENILTIDDLPKHEQVIVSILETEHKYSASESLNIFNKYRFILIELNLNKSQHSIAKFLNKYYKENINQTEWLNHILLIKNKLMINNYKSTELNDMQKIIIHKNMQNIEYYQLSSYEKHSVDYLSFIHMYSLEKALNIFNMYYEVFNKISGDEEPSFYGEIFGNAYNENYSPQEWMNRINKYHNEDEKIKILIQVSPHRNLKGFKNLKLIKCYKGENNNV